MKDIFPLVDSFGILSLLFSNKEKYKDHPVLKQIEELSTKPLYVVFNGEALVKCIQYKQPETFAKFLFPQQPKPKHRFSAVFVSNIH